MKGMRNAIVLFFDGDGNFISKWDTWFSPVDTSPDGLRNGAREHTRSLAHQMGLWPLGAVEAHLHINRDGPIAEYRIPKRFPAVEPRKVA